MVCSLKKAVSLKQVDCPRTTEDPVQISQLFRHLNLPSHGDILMANYCGVDFKKLISVISYIDHSPELPFWKLSIKMNYKNKMAEEKGMVKMS